MQNHLSREDVINIIQQQLDNVLINNNYNGIVDQINNMNDDNRDNVINYILNNNISNENNNNEINLNDLINFIENEYNMNNNVNNENNNVNNENNNVNNEIDPNDDVNVLMNVPRCSICLDNNVAVVFNCGHMCSCNACSVRLDQCPICRTNINFRRRVYFP